MLLCIVLFIASFLLVLFLNIVSFLLAENVPFQREELTSYECGFEHHNLSRVPFSLRYFFLTLIFLLFDLEIILILFVPVVIFSVNFFVLFLVLLLFIFILYLSLMYEWLDGSLEWVS